MQNGVYRAASELDANDSSEDSQSDASSEFHFDDDCFDDGNEYEQAEANGTIPHNNEVCIVQFFYLYHQIDKLLTYTLLSYPTLPLETV